MTLIDMMSYLQLHITSMQAGFSNSAKEAVIAERQISVQNGAWSDDQFCYTGIEQGPFPNYM